MKTILLKEQVDIYQCPKPRINHQRTQTITLGDLHANPIKLLFSLIKEGVAELPVNHYNALVQLYLDTYRHPDIDIKTHMDSFNELIEHISIINPHIRIRLLGDELADRGVSDGYMLVLLNKLHHEHIQMKSILSNHLAEFIEAIEYYPQRLQNNTPYPSAPETGYLYGSHISSQSNAIRSLLQLSKWLQHQTITFDSVVNMFKNSYQHMLCLLDAEYDEALQRIFIYSHAPIGLRSVFALAACMEISPQNTELPLLIQQVNDYFDKHYLHGSKYISSLYMDDNSESSRRLQEVIMFMLWNREGNHGYLLRKKIFENNTITWVHGHDYQSEPDDIDEHYVINLDNLLGKQIHLNQGEYKILLHTQS